MNTLVCRPSAFDSITSDATGPCRGPNRHEPKPVRRGYTCSFAAEVRFCRQERAMRLAKSRRTAKRVGSPDEAIVRESGLAKPQPSRTGEKCVSVYLSPEKWLELKILAVTTDTTIDALMRRAADRVLAELKPKPAKRPGGKRREAEARSGKEGRVTVLNVDRHPEVRAKRASKDAGRGARAVVLRGSRWARAPQDDGQQQLRFICPALRPWRGFACNCRPRRPGPGFCLSWRRARRGRRNPSAGRASSR